MRPGFKTTEFWLPVIALVGGIVLVALGHTELGSGLLGGSLFGGGTYQKGRQAMKEAGAVPASEAPPTA